MCFDEKKYIFWQDKKMQYKKETKNIPGYLWYFKKVYISESNENWTVVGKIVEKNDVV